ILHFVLHPPAAPRDLHPFPTRRSSDLHCEPPLALRTKLPLKVAPACSSMMSPGFAASSAACRLSPALTRIVLPPGCTYFGSIRTRGSSGIAPPGSGSGPGSGRGGISGGAGSSCSSAGSGSGGAPSCGSGAGARYGATAGSIRHSRYWTTRTSASGCSSRARIPAASAVCSFAYVRASGSPSITTRNGLPPVETGCGAGTMVGSDIGFPLCAEVRSDQVTTRPRPRRLRPRSWHASLRTGWWLPGSRPRTQRGPCSSADRGPELGTAVPCALAAWSATTTRGHTCSPSLTSVSATRARRARSIGQSRSCSTSYRSVAEQYAQTTLVPVQTRPASSSSTSSRISFLAASSSRVRRAISSCAARWSRCSDAFAARAVHWLHSPQRIPPHDTRTITPWLNAAAISSSRRIVSLAIALAPVGGVCDDGALLDRLPIPVAVAAHRAASLAARTAPPRAPVAAHAAAPLVYDALTCHPHLLRP